MTEIYQAITEKKQIIAGMQKCTPTTTRGSAVYVLYNDGTGAWVESHCCKPIK